jgi:hemerythrin HHE cation binding domain-containing protein
MKRSAALAPLSRDHQHALDAALRLRRADCQTVADAVAHFQQFLEREGRRHFAIEERLLLPALPADAEWAPYVARVRDDHATIRAAAATLADPSQMDDPVGSARALGERLATHVRFEERAVFDILERRLTPLELERLGQAVADAERHDAPPFGSL